MCLCVGRGLSGLARFARNLVRKPLGGAAIIRRFFVIHIVAMSQMQDLLPACGPLRRQSVDRGQNKGLTTLQQTVLF
ncbi:hypothetical protein CKO21_12930 [Rhodovibrio salinarum]|uniref:Uncharacterized protein n=1 Tax=Rhodovibrio salinarum TaxID=1087 RepID=A0A934V1G5_9PROT|nr:hypothetical protein [Rhodovibrio salinarum]